MWSCPERLRGCAARQQGDLASLCVANRSLPQFLSTNARRYSLNRCNKVIEQKRSGVAALWSSSAKPAPPPGGRGGTQRKGRAGRWTPSLPYELGSRWPLPIASCYRPGRSITAAPAAAASASGQVGAKSEPRCLLSPVLLSFKPQLTPTVVIKDERRDIGVDPGGATAFQLCWPAAMPAAGPPAQQPLLCVS